MLKILFTNIVFSERTGTEVAAFELCRALRARGHFVAVYSPTVGVLAHEARASGIPVASRIDKIGFVPDIIHGHHNIPLAIAMTAFRKTPAIFVCHDLSSIYDEAPLHSHIREYVAVDAACRERLILEGVDPAAITIMANGVALDKYRKREQWAERPRTALLVVKKRIEHVALVEEACSRFGIDFEVVGAGVGRLVADLPDRYLKSDIVFAHSRSAIEAAATGAAVIIIDEYGYGGRLSLSQIAEWPETTLSRRILRRSTTAEEIHSDIDAYSANEARLVCELLRERVDLNQLALHWEKIYTRVVASEYVGDNAGDSLYFATFLERFLPSPFDLSRVQQESNRDLTLAETCDRLALLFGEFCHDRVDRVFFRKGALGPVLLDKGWHMPEDANVWSAGGSVSLWLPSALIEAWDGTLLIHCNRYVPPNLGWAKAKPIAIKLDNTTLDMWTFDLQDLSEVQGQRLVIPDMLRPPRGGAVKLTFEIEDAISPKAAGDGADQRVLGLSLSQIARG